jgi:hypothetical protein
MIPNILALLQSQDKPMSTDWTHCTPETLASAIRACREERIANGLDPDSGRPIQVPVTCSVRRLTLVHDAPLRLHLEESQIDRTASLATALDELIESGYTTVELRRHLDLIDAANEGDSY